MAYNPLQYLTQNQPNTFAMLSQVGRSLGEGRRRQLELSRQADQEAAGQRAAEKLGLLAQDLSGQRATGGLTGQGAAGNLELLTKAEPQFTPEIQGQFYQDALASGQGGLLLGEYGRLTDVDAPVDYTRIGQLIGLMDGLATDYANSQDPAEKRKIMAQYDQYNTEYAILNKGETYNSQNFKRGYESQKSQSEAAEAQSKAELAEAKQKENYVNYVDAALKQAYDRNKKGIEKAIDAINFAGQARDNIIIALRDGGGNDAIVQQITTGLKKIQDPASAVMEGEARAMLGSSLAAEIRRGFEALKPLIKEGDAKAAENKAQATDIYKFVKAYNALLPSLKRMRENVLSGQLNDEQLRNALATAKQQNNLKDTAELDRLLKEKAQIQFSLPSIPAAINQNVSQAQDESTNVNQSQSKPKKPSVTTQQQAQQAVDAFESLLDEEG